MGGVNANTDAKSIHFALASRRKRCSMSSRRFTGRVCRFRGKSRKNFVLSSFAECFFRELLKIDKTLCIKKIKCQKCRYKVNQRI